MSRGSPRPIPWRMLVWLTLVWLLLWGDLSLGTLLAGALIAVIVTTALPLPAVHLRGRIHLLARHTTQGRQQALRSGDLLLWQLKTLLMLRKLGPPYSTSPSQLATMLNLTRGALSLPRPTATSGTPCCRACWAASASGRPAVTTPSDNNTTAAGGAPRDWSNVCCTASPSRVAWGCAWKRRTR